MEIIVLLAVACLSCSVGVVWCDFKTVNDTELDLIAEVYHVFDNSDRSLCVVIPGDDSDVVIQPGVELGVNRTDGEFRVETGGDADQFGSAFGVITQTCKIQCPGTSASSGFCFEPPVIPGEPPECNQLVFKPGGMGIGGPRVSGEFLIQYVPQGMQPISVTVRFSSPGIYFSGNSSVPILIMADTAITLDFTLWPTSKRLPPSGQMRSVCEILNNGTSMDSNKLSIRPGPRNDRTCFTPLAVVTVPVSIIRTDLVLDSLTPGSTCRVFLSQGACVLDTTLADSSVTIIVPVSTTTRATAMETTAEMTTILPPTSGDLPVPLAAIVGVAVLAVLLIVGVAVTILICCVLKRRNKSSSPIDSVNKLEMKTVGEVKLSNYDEVKLQRAVPVRMDNTNEYVQCPPSSMDTVSSVAFVTASDSPNYKKLEKEILTQHSCERVHPVAMVDSGHTPSFDEFWCGITKLLKKGCCLVYVIWSGALETVNGTHYPPIKKLICSLTDRPLRINDSRGSSSVMHRLIFLQLGSKGTVDHLLSNLKSVTVFWETSADDDTFDAKQCAQSVCKMVKEKLKAHSVLEKTRKPKQDGGLVMVKESTYLRKQPLKTGRAVVGEEGVDGNTLQRSPYQSTDTLGPQETSTTSLAPDEHSQVSLDPETIDMLSDRIGDRFVEKIEKTLKDQHQELKQDLGEVQGGLDFLTEKKMEEDIKESADQ